MVLAYLRLVEGGLVNFILECLGDCCALEDRVLAEEEPVLECELGEGEANDEPLPREERPVEPAAQALFMLDTGPNALCRRKSYLEELLNHF